MPTSDNSISRLIINELTQAQYDALINAGQINPNELYMVTDGSYPVVNDFANVAFTGEYSDLLNTPTIPEAQVQSDWNASSGMGVILNKPTLATVATTGEYSDLLNTPTLSIVAGTGEYSDLLNKPTIPLVDQAYNGSSTNAQSGTAVASLIANYMTASDVINVINIAVSSVYRYKGSVANYSSLPASGQAVGDVWNVEDTGDNYAWDGTAWDKLAGTVDLSNYVTLNTAQTITNKTINIADNTIVGLATIATTGEWNNIVNKPSFATVATTGEYSDLLNKPSIPDAQVQSDWNATSGMGVILNKPTLSTVATTGEYSDLLNKPTWSYNSSTETLTLN